MTAEAMAALFILVAPLACWVAYRIGYERGESKAYEACVARINTGRWPS